MAKTKNPQIFIATPVFGNMLTDSYVLGLLSLVQLLEKEKISYTINIMSNQSLVTRARNKLSALFMADPKNTHLMFIDADIAFNPRDIVGLLEHNKDVAAGTYPKKAIHTDLVKKAVENEDENFITAGTAFNLALNNIPGKNNSVRINGNLVDTLFVGAGFMLVRRNVIGKIIAKGFAKKCKDDEEFERNFGKFYYDIFKAETDPKTKLYLSEDYYFCNLVKKLGFKIWTDTTINLGHVGTYTYWGNLNTYLGLRKKI
ncbi:MAG: hypothetical protein COU25_02625 [Candidatus Levybacteria bacterium CG10_big_fil_rev_8_21_14_0_10_35_13]|nr:MAG: hypothetical protein COU25_02625 [Candidatus Levybacteria bacterium CG10_big_fil_rev_8_21_14_0_10_35_13]